MVKFNDLLLVERSNSNEYRTPIFKYLGRVDNTISCVKYDPIKDKPIGDIEIVDLHKVRFVYQVDTGFSMEDQRIISQIAMDLETGRHLLSRRSEKWVSMFIKLKEVLYKVERNLFISKAERKLYIEYLSNLIE